MGAVVPASSLVHPVLGEETHTHTHTYIYVYIYIRSFRLSRSTSFQDPPQPENPSGHDHIGKHDPPPGIGWNGKRMRAGYLFRSLHFFALSLSDCLVLSQLNLLLGHLVAISGRWAGCVHVRTHRSDFVHSQWLLLLFEESGKRKV